MKSHADPVTRRDERPVKVTTPLTPGDRTDNETLWWKQALRQVAGAALRLHHYRYVRSRMLRDVLSREAPCVSVCVSRCGDDVASKH